MAEVRIYKLNLGAADLTYSGFWRRTTCGGVSAPNTDYPEFGEMENVQRNEGAGASGQHVIDAVNTTDYTVSWITLVGVGNLTNGQFDTRGGGAGKPIKCRWKQFFRSSALAEAGYSVPLVLAHGGADGSSCGINTSQVFFLLAMNQTAGASFQWSVDYQSIPAGATPFTFFTNPTITGSTDTSDNVEHEIIVTLTPSTVTGAYFGGGGVLGTAVVAADGAFDVSVDGVSVLSASGLRFVINNFATTNPAVYYGKTIWHGD